MLWEEEFKFAPKRWLEQVCFPTTTTIYWKLGKLKLKAKKSPFSAKMCKVFEVVHHCFTGVVTQPMEIPVSLWNCFSKILASTLIRDILLLHQFLFLLSLPEGGLQSNLVIHFLVFFSLKVGDWPMSPEDDSDMMI